MGLLDFFKRRNQRESALGDGSTISVGSPAQRAGPLQSGFPGAAVSQSSQTVNASNVAGLRDNMLEILKRHGIDPSSGQSMAVDASNFPGLAEEIQGALSGAGIQVGGFNWSPEGTPGLMQMGQPPDGADIEERLRKLTELLQSGLISQAEFEQQRSRIIGTV